MFNNLTDAVFQETLSKVHVVVEVGKGNFRFDHPKLGQVAGSVRVFSSESRAKGINLT